MKDCNKRWLYLLAGSALSAREIRDMCVWLAGEDRDDIVALVMRLRREDIAPVAIDAVSAAASDHSVVSKKVDALGDIAAEIALVLRTESHLTAREAATRLAAELEKERHLGSDVGITADVPTYSKESFRVYVGKLLKHSPPRVLLHLAHRIRDSIVDRQQSAWPLRGGEG